jgi:hypothetical protein
MVNPDCNPPPPRVEGGGGALAVLADAGSPKGAWPIEYIRNSRMNNWRDRDGNLRRASQKTKDDNAWHDYGNLDNNFLCFS